MASEVLKIDLKASDSTGAAFASLQRSMSGVSKSFASVQNVVKGGLGLLVAGNLGEAIGAVRQYADAWTMMTNRLKSAGLTSGETAIAQQKIVDIASRSRSSLAEVGNLYARIAFSTETLGTSQSDVAKITETLSKAFKSSGKTALEAQSAVTQFTQALASGVLQGDELRSLRENAPEVARAIADAFGVSVGELKKLGAEGQLTADKIVPAILNASAKIEERFSQTRSTFEDYGIAISNFFQTSVASIQDFVFGTQQAVSAMQKVADQEKMLRAQSGTGIAVKPIDPELLGSLKAAEGIKEQAKELEGFNQVLNDLVNTLQAPTYKSFAKGQNKVEIISPSEVATVRELFAEFQKTPQTSEDFVQLKLSIEEALNGKLNYQIVDLLSKIITQAAGATAQIQALFAAGSQNYQPPGTGPAPSGGYPTPQFKPSDIRSNTSIEAMKEMDAFRRTFFLNQQYYIKTASEQEKLALELIADAKGKDITLSMDQARLQAEGIIKQNDAAGAAKKYGDEIESLKEKYENVADPLKKFNDDLAEVEMLYKKGAIGANTYSNAVANINKAKQDFIEKSDPMKDQLKELERAFDGFGKKSADAIAEFVVSGKMDFKDLIQTMIKEMISMMIYQNLLKGMFTGAGGGFNLASLFGMGGGGQFSYGAGGYTGMGPFMAKGGPVSANSPYIVGEKGPELFMPGSSGSIVPNNRLGGGSDGVTINQTINISTGVQQTVRAEIQQLLPQISNAAKNAILDTKRRGGQFANAFGG